LEILPIFISITSDRGPTVINVLKILYALPEPDYPGLIRIALSGENKDYLNIYTKMSHSRLSDLIEYAIKMYRAQEPYKIYTESNLDQ